GRAWIQEVPITDPSSRARLGFLPEGTYFHEYLTGREFLDLHARLLGLPRRIRRAETAELLERVGMSHAADLQIGRYSKGMRQRVGLAQALLGDPDVLILDEPMSGLDPLGRQLVVDIIRDYNLKGNTILFCSHILTDVERICTRIAVMDKGKLAASLAPSELASHENAVKVQQGGASPLESYFLSIITKSSDNE
ncbi:MAG: ABC transporter ATP-binding protein, partial [Desulfobulbaceae bacterium]|nr:ABC transporter ATP-binding protein [Desulfobulbaceae bacterium]